MFSMRIERLCKSYLSGFPGLWNCRQRTNSEVCLAAVKVFGCLLLLPLTVIVAAAYGVCRCISTTPPNTRATSATQTAASRILNRERRGQQQIDVDEALNDIQPFIDLSTVIYRRKRGFGERTYWYTREQLVKFANDNNTPLTKDNLERDYYSRNFTDLATTLITAINKEISEITAINKEISGFNEFLIDLDRTSRSGISLHFFENIPSSNDPNKNLFGEMVECLGKLNYGLEVTVHIPRESYWIFLKS